MQAQVCSQRLTRKATWRSTVIRIRASSKGFGKNDAAKPQQQKKAFRPGQPSKAELKKQQEAMGKYYAATTSSSSSEDADDDVVPSVITDRMLKRVLIFAGAPVFLGVMLYPLFYYLKVVKQIEVPYGAVFVTQSLVFGIGLLGISYGAISASWDPSRQGSVLGWNEFKANLAAIRGKLGQQ